MNAKLVVEGKEFDIEILDLELQKLIKPKTMRATGYERVRNNDSYYYIDGVGLVQKTQEMFIRADDERHHIVNYHSDKAVAENNARADKLMRQLRRLAVEHREETIDYSVDKWYEVFYDYTCGKLKVDDVCECKYFGTIHFDAYETAKLAIDTFRDELIWYFTEYKDSL